MLFGIKKNLQGELKPFALRLREGYLVGLARDPMKGSPCSMCIERWLKERNVWAERIAISEVRASIKDKLATLMAEQNGHSFYEISENGTSVRLDCMIFPHPECSCNKNHYIGPQKITKQTNLAFSPIFKVKCVRYGTPNGNLWLHSVTGQSPITRRLITTYGVHFEKETSRFRAVDQWIKKATREDLPHRFQSGQTVVREELMTGETEIQIKGERLDNSQDSIGVGKTKEEAIVDALNTVAKQRTLSEYAATNKRPMLVVGTHAWLRKKVPYFLLQQYDLYLLFYPNAHGAWVTGLAAFSRLDTTEKPVFVFAAGSSVAKSLNEVILKVLEVCRPSDWKAGFKGPDPKNDQKISRLNMWWTHWIYRCPKIGLKEILHLEPYSDSLEAWRRLYRENGESVSFLHLNNESIPKAINYVVQIKTESDTLIPPSPKINGIGTWASVRDGIS